MHSSHLGGNFCCSNLEGLTCFKEDVSAVEEKAFLDLREVIGIPWISRKFELDLGVRDSAFPPDCAFGLQI